MLKKISFFALAALLFVGCSSEEEKEKEKRNFKDSVYAFVNSHPDIVGYGKVDVNAVMDESNMEQNSLFQMFAAPTYEVIKSLVDVKAPVYIATATSENHSDLTMYMMFKLKNQKKMVEELKEMGYEFKDHNGISYAEDEDYVISARNETVIIIAAPGDYDGKSLVSQAFKYTEGKLAKGKMKKRLEAKGDFVMHMNLDGLKANDPSLRSLPDGTEVDFALNFEEGKMIFETNTNNFADIEQQMGMEMTDDPIISKKITDEEGNVIMAMQLSMESKLLNMIGIDAEEMSNTMNMMPLAMDGIEGSIEVSDLTPTDNVVMPETGKAMGGQYMEMMIDLDAVMAMQPEMNEYEEYWSKLDYASMSINKDGTMRIVVTTDEEGQNFLATVFEAVDAFMNNGGLMQIMAMQ